jgi:hypothetical protein
MTILSRRTSTIASQRGEEAACLVEAPALALQEAAPITGRFLLLDQCSGGEDVQLDGQPVRTCRENGWPTRAPCLSSGLQRLEIGATVVQSCARLRGLVS